MRPVGLEQDDNILLSVALSDGQGCASGAARIEIDASARDEQIHRQGIAASDGGNELLLVKVLQPHGGKFLAGFSDRESLHGLSRAPGLLGDHLLADGFTLLHQDGL